MNNEESKKYVRDKSGEVVQEKTNCCDQSYSCCDDSKSGLEKKIVSKTPTLLPSQKLQIDIFVPLDMCSCVWDKYINRTFEILTPYIKYISFNTKNINSEEARKLNIYENCVVIDGKTKFTSSYVLKEQLPDILKQKGLL